MSVSKRLSDGRAAEKRGDKSAAQNAYFGVLVDYPGNKAALRALVDLMGGDSTTKALNADLFVARAYYTSAKFDEAKECALALLEKAPGTPEVLLLLGSIAGSQDRTREAIEYFQAAVEANPMGEGAYHNLGKSLLKAGDIEAGVAALRKLVEIAPDSPTAHRRLAAALRLAGDTSGARQTLESALEKFPENALLMENLPVVKKYDRADHPDILRLSRMLNSGKLTKDGVQALAIAAARSLENTDVPDKAVKAFKHGNALRKEELSYDFSSDAMLFDNIKRIFAKPIKPLPADDGRPKPIFIVGMPRSGTSLMEQILAAHSQVFGGGELSWWNNNLQSQIVGRKGSGKFDPSPDQLLEMREGYRDLLSNVSNGETYVTDKMPMNFRWIGAMAAIFPDAPILHMKRDPRATCWSVYKLPFPAGGLAFTFDAEDVVAYFEQYRQLMDFWDRVLPGRVTHVSYEYLTENQEAETRRLVDLCGLPWEDATLEFHKSKRSVATASSSQVRQKMYKGSSEAWRKFAPYLPELFEALPEKY